MRNLVRRVPPLLTILLLAIWLTAQWRAKRRADRLRRACCQSCSCSASRNYAPFGHAPTGCTLLFPLPRQLLVDIVRSNLGVARVVLGLVRDRQVRSGFLEIPLELTDPHALTILAVIVTSTPGYGLGGDVPRRTHAYAARAGPPGRAGDDPSHQAAL